MKQRLNMLKLGILLNPYMYSSYGLRADVSYFSTRFFLRGRGGCTQARLITAVFGLVRKNPRSRNGNLMITERSEAKTETPAVTKAE